MKFKFKRILKTIGLIFAILLTGLILTFYWFVQPVSDTAVLEKFNKSSATPTLLHKIINTHDIRIITNRKNLDNKLPSIVFIHGTPGSSLDFKRKSRSKNNGKISGRHSTIYIYSSFLIQFAYFS